MATSPITVLVPTSPIPSHPDTRIIDETIASIRVHLPNAEIILMIDGIREEQAHFKQKYQDYIRKILYKANKEWAPCTPLLFEEHTHQANMTRKALTLVKTPQILFVEHDTPLTPDRFIPFEALSDYVKEDKAHVIRFHHEALVLEVHKHLMIGEPEGGLWATYQWSQRPHLTTTDYYKHIMETYFSPNAKSFIEDRMYSVLETAYRDRGRAGWDEHRVWMYYPEGDIKRSYHSDGREGGEKYDDTQIF